MANKIKINNIEIAQPDSGLGYDFETTYTADSTRVQSGKGNFTAMFTVEAFSYTRSGLTGEQVKTILQNIVGKNFSLYYFSPYYGAWRTDTFYVGKGSLSIGFLDGSTGMYDSLSFNMIGVNKLV